MDKKYGPDLKKVKQTDITGRLKRKQSNPFKGKKGEEKRKKLYQDKAEERRTKNIDNEIKYLRSQYDLMDIKKITKFLDFPLSSRTLQGLLDAGFNEPTEIQRQAICIALRGLDILGAAKTGSGKTLAFLVPILECLFLQKWSNQDGMAALIISPTRELAYQTFEVLRKVGRKHDFSAGLVIGGKRLSEEAARINRTNIVICTPGRLLQHMDETPYFNADSLQILVLDEADRILDFGFAQAVNAILENLPSSRQTLLFSATQTRSIKDLARLSLTQPMLISAHELSQYSTPSSLCQYYMECDLHDKFNLLWSFVASHRKSKIITFIATSKQVKFFYEVFIKLRCSISIHCLYGSMNQIRRLEMYEMFVRKEHALLFATDVAARGLDFPSVHWVVQMDCPEDPDTYIHRVGRTARYERDGQALLILLPSEKNNMVKQLEDKKIPIEEIKVNPQKVWKQQARIESLMAAESTIKMKAQKAFTTYLKSVYIMKDKTVFDYSCLDIDSYARSLGLAITPKIRFLDAAKRQKVLSKKKKINAESENANDGDDVDVFVLKSKNDKDGDEDNNDVEDFETTRDDDDDDESLFHVKPTDYSDVIPEPSTEVTSKKKSKASKSILAKKLLKRNLTVNNKLTFDDDGEVLSRTNEADTRQPSQSGLDLKAAKKFMEREDKKDRETYREKIKLKHREERKKAKEERQLRNRHRMQQMDSDDEQENFAVTLKPSDDIEPSRNQLSSDDDDGEDDNVNDDVDDVSSSSDGESSYNAPMNPDDTPVDPDDADYQSGSDSDTQEMSRPLSRKKFSSLPEKYNFKGNVKDSEDLALILLNSSKK